jgi:putative addiction module component (TIGR02574 family)
LTGSLVGVSTTGPQADVTVDRRHSIAPRAEIELRLSLMETNRFSDLMRLSVAERIQLAEDLWDSVAAEPDALLPALTDAQRMEIERRLAEHEQDPSSARTWDEVRARLWATLG